MLLGYARRSGGLTGDLGPRELESPDQGTPSAALEVRAMVRVTLVGVSVLTRLNPSELDYARYSAAPGYVG